MSVPKLRFKDFDGNWSLNKLKQLTDVLKCGVASTPTYVDEGGYPFLSAQNVSRDGLMNYSKVNHISAEFYKKISKTKLLKGDILYSRVGASYGVASIFDKDEEYGVYVSLTHIRANKCLDNVFLKLFLNSPKARVQAERGVFQGGGVQNLNVGVVEEFELSIPSKEEQTKIASFLSAVDEKISQLTQKHELLSQYKQGMMQKLFSQQIRFKADDGGEFGGWEELKFKEVIKIKYGKDHKKLDDGDIPVLGTGGIMRYVDSYLYDGESILIGRKGTIDKPQFISGKFWTVDTLFYTEIGKKILPKFAFQQLLLVNWLNLNEATGVPSLNTTSIGNIELKVPSLKEQTKIANFLSAIDQKIEVVAQQIEQAKQWKKGLLQQMFV